RDVIVGDALDERRIATRGELIAMERGAAASTAATATASAAFDEVVVARRAGLEARVWTLGDAWHGEDSLLQSVEVDRDGSDREPVPRSAAATTARRVTTSATAATATAAGRNASFLIALGE